MSCAEWEDLIEKELDGALPPGDAERLAAHLNACTECRADLADGREVIGLLHSLPAPEVPSEAWPSVREALARTQQRKRSLRRAVLAAAAVLLVGIPAGIVALHQVEDRAPGLDLTVVDLRNGVSAEEWAEYVSDFNEGWGVPFVPAPVVDGPREEDE